IDSSISLVRIPALHVCATGKPAHSTPPIAGSPDSHGAIPSNGVRCRTAAFHSRREDGFSRTRKTPAADSHFLPTPKNAPHPLHDLAAAANRCAHIPGCSTRVLRLLQGYSAPGRAPYIRPASRRPAAALTETPIALPKFFRSEEKTDRAPHPPLPAIVSEPKTSTQRTAKTLTQDAEKQRDFDLAFVIG